MDIVYSSHIDHRVKTLLGTILICTITLLPGLILFSCAPRTDLSPVVTIGGEKISRACLDFAHGKTAARGKTKKETLDNLVNQALLARKAVEAGLHGTPGYARLSESAIDAARREFLCVEFAVTGDCASGLYSVLEKRAGLRCAAIEWERVFPRTRREPPPFGGALPEEAKQRTAGGNRTDWKYADTIAIRTLEGTTTAARILKSAGLAKTASLTDAGAGERERLFRDILISLFMDDLTRLLAAGRRDLLTDIEKRADEHVLAGMFRESLKSTGSSPGGILPPFPVSESDASDYYRKNLETFSEPVWVDLSHIRVADYGTARAIQGKLKDSPGRFCELAGRHSSAADKSRCGRLGKIVRRKGLPLHLEFAFTLLKEGDISEPVKSGAGYEILKLNARGVRPLAFKDPHTRRLLAEKMRPLLMKKALDDALREMAAKFPVVYYP